MTLQELKNAIETKSLPNELLIFKSTNPFLVNHYIEQIAKLRNVEISYIDELTSLLYSFDCFFNETFLENDSNLRVYKEDIFLCPNLSITDLTNLIIVVNKFQDKEQEGFLKSYIIEFPELEDWQWKDYVYSCLEGVDQDEVDWFYSLCKDRFRAQTELDKVGIFKQEERKYLFKDLIRDGLLDDLSSYNIFNFSTALMNKNLITLGNIYKEFERADIEPYGLLTILKKNFKNLLMVQLTANPTPENTGLEGKQLYAIKKQPKVFSPDQLIEIYSFLCDLDRQIKEGELPTTILVDYIVIKILSM